MTSTKILRRIGVAVGSLALLSTGATGLAAAQESAEGLDTSSSVSGSAEYRGSTGFKLSEDLVLHPRLDLEGGYQNNVFFEDDSETPVGSPILRIGVGASLATHDRRNEVAPKVALNADVQLIWNQYLSDNSSASKQSDLGINALAGMNVNPEGKVTFELRDGFTRSVNPPPVETSRELARDKNELVAGLVLKPGGGALQFYGNVTWTFDRFENQSLGFADRNSVIGAVGTKWQWLPKTQLNGEASYGLVSSDSPVKPGGNSTPLRVTVGTSTLITPSFGTVLRLGYGNSFYSRGGNYGSYLALAELRYAIGPMLRLAGGYSRDFADSLIGNYRVDDSFFARFSAQLAGHFLLGAKAQLSLRKYDGLPTMGSTIFCNSVTCSPSNASPTRDDVLFSASANADYQVNEWLTFGALYQLYSDNTKFVATSQMAGAQPDSLGFVWQEIVVKATANY